MRLSERMPRESGRDYALRNIKANIVNLELAPGSQISENELAVEMGLSRTPVREALIELSKVEIIESHPQRKSTVSLIDYDLVEESRFMRNLLECAVVELVCEMAGPMDVERLNANIRLQSFYLDGTYTNELMASRFSDVMWLMEQIMWKSLDRRVAAFLLEEASIESTNRLKITHEIIANHLGSHREVITRMLRYFQNEGMVRLSRGTIEITDADRLAELSEM